MSPAPVESVFTQPFIELVQFFLYWLSKLVVIAF